MDRQPLASAKEVAKYLDVPLRTIYRWHQNGTGPRMSRVGGHLKARWADVDAWLQSRSSGGQGGVTENPLADIIGELSDEQLRRIAALLKLRQAPQEAPAQEARRVA